MQKANKLKKRNKGKFFLIIKASNQRCLYLKPYLTGKQLPFLDEYPLKSLMNTHQSGLTFRVAFKTEVHSRARASIAAPANSSESTPKSSKEQVLTGVP